MKDNREMGKVLGGAEGFEVSLDNADLVEKGENVLEAVQTHDEGQQAVGEEP